MPFYHKLGQVPHKRHTQFKKPNGKLSARNSWEMDSDKINLAALKPVGRLAGSGYVRVTDVFEMERPKTQIKG